MDGLLESFSRVTRVWCTMRRREEGARSCFDSFLFSLPPPLVSLLRPSSSFSLVRFLLSPPHSIHSLFSRIRLERGYSLNLNVFFFPSSRRLLFVNLKRTLLSQLAPGFNLVGEVCRFRGCKILDLDRIRSH